MCRFLIIAACVLLTSAAHAETSDRYSGGGAYSQFKPALDRANQSGELFRIRGTCSSNCTMFLGVRNVCVERSARLMFRRSPVGVVLETPQGQRVQARAETGGDTVVLRGAPAELLLAAYGRRRVAELEEVGDHAAVQALWAAPTGLS